MDDIFFTTQKNGSKLNFFNRLLNIFYYLSIILFFIGFNFTDSQPFGWYQQFLPDLNGKQITDITFPDSLIGFAVTNYANGNSYILKTSNGGDNWSIKLIHDNAFSRIMFINTITGYTTAFTKLLKTTNSGENWNFIDLPSILGDDMFVLNEDTIWLAMSESLTGGVFRTTNGGISWTQQFAGGTQNPSEIYMYNARIGFIGGNPSPRVIRKTTDGGNSWFIVHNNDYFQNMYFADSLTGWKSSVFGMKKTTDGGLNWITQILPSGGIIQVSGIYSFSNINKDTIWGAGGYVIYPNNQARRITYRTTNSGTNWYFQIPDTSIRIDYQYYVKFVNKYNGWMYSLSPSGIHTVTGGDTIFLTSVRQISSEVPKDYILFQNYPNPFNPVSNIRYQVLINSNVKIVLYNISGKEIATLVNEKKSPGTYEATIDARLPYGQSNNLSSGVYFYTLIVNDKVIDTKKAVLIK